MNTILPPSPRAIDLLRHELTDVEAADQGRLNQPFKFDWILFQETATSVTRWIADQDVDRDLLIDGCLDQCFTPGSGKHIGCDRSALSTEATDLAGHITQFWIAGTIVDHQIGTLTGKFNRAAASDTLCRSGDQRCFAQQFQRSAP